MRSKMSGILPDLSSQSVLSHNWLLLFLFVHVLTSRERGAFGGCGGHIERQGEALGREDQLQTYKRRFDDEEEDSTTSTTNLFDFRSWSWRSMKVVRDRVYWNLKDAFLWKGFESSKTSLMYPWPLDMVLANPPQNKMLILLRKYWNTKASHQPIFSLSQTVDGGWPLPLAPDRGQKKGQKTRAEKRGKRPASRSPRGFQRRGEVAEPPDGRGLGL